ncbi:alpha/beta-hydrolase [Microthyrium microscopicum]|uniref:Alpha/beta-hydrolase n=1 Tax=Microthyrium microscopicum TaxID=703497 RepID=A0A6A6U1Q6_9PEZI|nr:alpha/beta-hydrolase [Microthyrium microscopicum]
MEPSEFKISIPDSDLDLLMKKLELTRLPDGVEGYEKAEGVPIARMKGLVEFWRTSYLPNWRKHERELNELPMYTMPVKSEDFGTLNIHFVHQKSKQPNAIPLLFIHGWPGSFLEAKKLLKVLGESNNDEPAFDIIVPSLPNYAFSDGVPKAGFHLGSYGEVLHSLMLALDYPQYTIQGGDWGSMIGRNMARHYPTAVRAVHVNLAGVDSGSVMRAPSALVRWFWRWPGARDRDGLRRALNYVTVGNAYYRVQESSPQTVAYAFADSPVALLGWVGEKLEEWTDGYEWSDEELLTWISVYWFSKAGPGASVRIYHEAQKGSSKSGGFWDWIPVPLGVTQFPKDIVGMPSFLLPSLGDVVFESWAESGGHFAAWERPEKLAGDLRVMFGKGGGAYGVVAGRDGYD